MAITFAGEASEPSAEDEVEVKLSDLIDSISDLSPAVSFGHGRHTVRVAVDSNSASSAISEALKRVKAASQSAGLPSLPVVSVEATEWDELERELDRPTFPSVIGVSELASLLGVSKQRASELARAHRFPKPFAELASGPIWLEPTVRRFVAEWERRPGRPKAATG